ncbi:MAG: DUF3987 domain-containing protein [candidate division Zixibacteria bacterium]|nr:DUF3987 domain-containing protein [candidate division Zixibacteria bacterium]
MDNIFKENYRKYRNLNLVVLPCPRNSKGPVVKGWNKNPPPANYPQWERQNANDNLWVRLDSILVLDPDHPEAERSVQSLALPECPLSVSGNKSIHRWFRNPNGLKPLKVTTHDGDEAWLEVRTGSQGMVVPPSIHPETGKPYEWVVSPWEFQEKTGIAFPEFPIEIYEKIKAFQDGPEMSRGESPPPKMEPVQEDSSLRFLDVPKYLAHYGIRFKNKQDGTRTIYALEQCLFAENHTTKDVKGDSSIIQGPDGKLGFHCFHNHCAGKTWHDARMAISGTESLRQFFDRGLDSRRESLKDTSSTERRNSGFEAPRTHEFHEEPKPRPEGDPLKSIYSGWAGEFSRIYAEATEPPRSFYFISALTCLGNVISTRVTLESEISPQPRLYTVILGESADDRKSTAIKKTVEFFWETMTEFSVCYGVGSAEGLAERFDQARRLLLVFDEFKSFVSKAKIETSVLLQTVNSLFESNIFESATKKRDITITNAHLSVLAASTVSTYSNLFDAQFLDIGFCNRLFVVKDTGKRRWAVPPKISEEAKAPLKKGLQEILARVKPNAVNVDSQPAPLIELKLTKEAAETFQDWYLKLEQERSQATKRLDTYALRFMILLAINDGKTEVDLETAKKTFSLMEYELRVRNEVDPIDADTKIAAMEEKIRRVLRNGPLILSILKKKTHYERMGIWYFETARRNLETYGEIWFDKKSGLYHLQK